jgi:hypothetical protein
VVIAASDSVEAVARTLAALGRQRGPGDLQVIIAATRDRVATPLPPAGPLDEVCWVIAAPGTSVPRLRRLGLDRASAPLVAFTEDSCVFGPGWAEAWVAAFRDARVQAATGPVEAAMGQATIDWAVFLCEYAPFLAEDGRSAGPLRRLAGNNFAVRRSDRGILDGPEIHENDVAGALASDSGAIVTVAAARVRHIRCYSLREAIGDRLRFGHAYGRLRGGRWSRWSRLAGLFAGPAILGVQAARLTALLIARRRYLGRFLEVLPVTVALLSAWSVGEWLGLLRASLPPPAARRRHETGGRPASPRLALARARSARCTAVPPAA